MLEIGYARVSTAEQANDSHALESQESRLLGAGCQPVFCEVGSGGSDRRKLFQRMWKMVKEGSVRSVSVTRIDRISRNLLTLRQFLSDCEDKKVVVKAIDQGIFSDTAHGKFALNILGSLAEWELDNLKERVDRGWKFLQENKRAPGVVPFGYVRGKGGDGEGYIPARGVQYRDSDKDRWSVALEVLSAIEKACSLRGAVRELYPIYGDRIPKSKPEEDYPREIGLRYWIQNPVLRGHISYYYRYTNRDRVNGRWIQGQKPVILIPNQHEPLITPERWDGIERILNQTSRQRDTSNWSIKPLAGLVRCQACGGKVRCYKNSKKQGEDSLRLARWYCNGIYTPIPTCLNRKGILNETLEESVHQALALRAKEIASLFEQGQETELTDSPEIKELLGSLASLEVIPSNPYIEKAKQDIQLQIQALREDQKQSQQVKSLLADELIETMENQFFWSWLDPLKRRAYYLRFVEWVWVLDGSVVEVDLRI